MAPCAETQPKVAATRSTSSKGVQASLPRDSASGRLSHGPGAVTMTPVSPIRVSSRLEPTPPLTATRASLPALALGDVTAERLASAGIELSGDATVLSRLAGVLDPGDPDFAIVTPDKD